MQDSGVSNLERHVRRFHPNIFAEIEKAKKDVEQVTDSEPPPKKKKRETRVINGVRMSLPRLKKCLLKLVAVSGRPFSLINDEGLQEIVQALVAAMPGTGRKTITAEDVRRDIITTASEERDRISKECRGRLLSLKLDGVSRLGRSFLGVNVQFIAKGRIELRTLCVKELTESHTSDNLKTTVEEVLKLYHIELSQLYSATVDNGANMLKLVNLLRKAVQEKLMGDNAPDGSFSSINMEAEDSFAFGELNDEVSTEEEEREEMNRDAQDDAFTDVLEECAKNLLTATDGRELQSHTVALIRCAAHCLNLAVKDSLKDPTTEALVRLSRQVSKKVRTPTIVQILRRKGFRVPMLDVETRWFSTADMLEGVLLLRDFVLDLKYQLKVNVTARDFDNLEDLQKVLRPARELCTRLQAEQLVIGDFFGAWLECKLRVKSVGLPLATILYKNMEKREHDLFSSPAVASSLYLDPRYFTLLTPDACELAENVLEKTWVRIVRERKRHEQSTSAESSSASIEDVVAATPSSPEFNEDSDPLESLLKISDEGRMATLQDEVQPILPLLRKFKSLPRIPRSSNLLDYWESQKHAMPEVYALAVVVHAAPSTQVCRKKISTFLSL